MVKHAHKICMHATTKFGHVHTKKMHTCTHKICTHVQELSSFGGKLTPEGRWTGALIDHPKDALAVFLKGKKAAFLLL